MIDSRRFGNLSQEQVNPTEIGATLLRLLRYFCPFWKIIAVVAVLMIVSTFLQIAAPYLTGLAVDLFINPAVEREARMPFWLQWLLRPDASRTVGLMWTMLLTLVVYLLAWVTTVAQFYLMMLIGQRVLLRLRTQIFERVQTLTLAFFKQHEAGDLMSRLVNDTDVINQAFSGGIVGFTSIGLTLFGILVSMVSLNWRLALVSFVVLPVMVMCTNFFSRRARTAFRRTRETIGEVSAELQENIAAVREVQAFAREDESVAAFEAVNAANRDANVQAQVVLSAFSPTLDVLSTIALAIVAGYGGYLALRDPPLISVGVIISFVIYVRRFYDPIRALAILYAQLQAAVAGADRVFDLLDMEPALTDAPDAIPLPLIQGRVTFDRVSFAYDDEQQDQEEDVLREISLTAEPGETVALVGPTGAGKTTLVSLLARFYDVDEGVIRIDGHDLRSVTRESLRKQIGIVLQDTFLFSGSVMENIRYGRLDASDEEVLEAAQLAKADRFIQRLPRGYETELGERGHTLSQGQRQLIAIARAILADPRILILDEATSSVDTRTERLIQRALDEVLLSRGRTAFVIAHRLSTIRNADQVLVLERGSIIERGTHDQLLDAGGLYAELYNSQFRRDLQPADAG